MKVTRINHDHDDLTVVNAARVSFDKYHRTFDDDKDTRLIQYLASHNHWTPFGHCRYTAQFGLDRDHVPLELLEWASKAAGAEVRFHGRILEITDSLWGWLHTPPPGLDPYVVRCVKEHAPVSGLAIECRYAPVTDVYLHCESFFPDDSAVTYLLEMPIFVARQLMRSNVGIVWNEVSRRYVDELPTFWYPKTWRGRPEGGMKQGSTGVLDGASQQDASSNYNMAMISGYRGYEELLSLGVAPEQARAVLPTSTMTKLWGTFTRNAVERVLGLREDSHAQGEIQELARMMREQL